MPPLGDTNKAVEAIWKVAALDNPSERLPLGKDSVNAIREKLEGQLKELALYESRSDDLVMVPLPEANQLCARTC
ncbi:hypothetical protein PUNSTDRAFT_54196 [Punctularia strigosozonata HHB-11173 SS5]|uniref:uncharacterized protein n=1 Tax=Punctularia strigosozonata (strain HHB-11173) TaxID=741275 RepID=UPI000441871B|nr:uncharacterized protein PUNSTDRAFT_54196 [Punctularia strigosozonata HHB-11173 SS5]EIN06830.1 hypothetical protein PUNSTDRAFT_54196 [Punctularia strigosozonata HHB-11173 SS5]